MNASRLLIITPFATLTIGLSASGQAPSAAPALARQVEVRRTTHGVPHIRAENLKAAYYALGYVQLEDYGSRVAMGLLRARGEMGKWFGRDSMETDFGAQRDYELAVENYPRLEQATRDAYEGFAAGVNRYVELHPREIPAGFKPNFTGYDVASPRWCLTRVAAVDNPRRLPSHRTRASMRSRRDRTRGRSRRAAQNQDVPFCSGIRTWPGTRVTTRGR